MLSYDGECHSSLAHRFDTWNVIHREFCITSALSISASGLRLEVIRIYARTVRAGSSSRAICRIVAKMIELQAVRNRALSLLVRKPVGGNLNWPIPSVPVSVLIERKLPDPAWRRIALIFLDVSKRLATVMVVNVADVLALDVASLEVALAGKRRDSFAVAHAEAGRIGRRNRYCVSLWHLAVPAFLETLYHHGRVVASQLHGWLEEVAHAIASYRLWLDWPRPVVDAANSVDVCRSSIRRKQDDMVGAAVGALGSVAATYGPAEYLVKRKGQGVALAVGKDVFDEWCDFFAKKNARVKFDVVAEELYAYTSWCFVGNAISPDKGVRFFHFLLPQIGGGEGLRDIPPPNQLIRLARA